MTWKKKSRHEPREDGRKGRTAAVRGDQMCVSETATVGCCFTTDQHIWERILRRKPTIHTGAKPEREGQRSIIRRRASIHTHINTSSITGAKQTLPHPSMRLECLGRYLRSRTLIWFHDCTWVKVRFCCCSYSTHRQLDDFVEEDLFVSKEVKHKILMDKKRERESWTNSKRTERLFEPNPEFLPFTSL